MHGHMPGIYYTGTWYTNRFICGFNIIVHVLAGPIIVDTYFSIK